MDAAIMPRIQELDFRNPYPKSSLSHRFNSDSLGTSFIDANESTGNKVKLVKECLYE